MELNRKSQPSWNTIKLNLKNKRTSKPDCNLSQEQEDLTGETMDNNNEDLTKSEEYCGDLNSNSIINSNSFTTLSSDEFELITLLCARCKLSGSRTVPSTFRLFQLVNTKLSTKKLILSTRSFWEIREPTQINRKQEAQFSHKYFPVTATS